ncbi:MAG: hypothetical protein DBP02_02005 [gamma proteobacterium symbiont of Ctena orbiculata]|nr:MAG: hypothetical protein DBP02_02005 [gamma proteobacterium symbiont of Ctena orbiculata]
MVSKDEIDLFIELDKSASFFGLSWQTQPGHENMWFVESTVIDNVAVTTIPDAICELRYYADPLLDRCKYLYTIFKVLDNVKYRLIQVEVVPKYEVAKRVHGIFINGPHYHIGDPRCESHDIYAIDEDISCDDYQSWLEFFSKIANIEITDPPELPAMQWEMQYD